mgnify:CR=1 FL=1
MGDEGYKCDRCGEIGQDRRTLWMACLYDMAELGLPFEEIAIRGAAKTVTQSRPLRERFRNEKVTAFLKENLEMVNGDKAQILNRFFTLYVCKDCRADWMQVIQGWFDTKPRRESTGTGVYIRDNGTNREATPEEVDEMMRRKSEN